MNKSLFCKPFCPAFSTAPLLRHCLVTLWAKLYSCLGYRPRLLSSAWCRCCAALFSWQLYSIAEKESEEIGDKKCVVYTYMYMRCAESTLRSIPLSGLPFPESRLRFDKIRIAFLDNLANIWKATRTVVMIILGDLNLQLECAFTRLWILRLQ